MYKANEVFEPPNDPNATIWRYMDFTKFVSLLQTKELFFARADKFEDPLEGYYPKITEQRISDTIAQQLGDDPLAKEAALSQFRALPRFVGINCWHLNDTESAAMWKLYLKSNEGVAIRTTFNKLCRAFGKAKENVFIGKVRYIDYTKDDLPNPFNVYSPFLYKRLSFKHEDELRAIVHKYPDQPFSIPVGDLDAARTCLDKIDVMESGVSIRVEIHELIEEVYIAPSSPSWFYNLVKTLTKKQYGLDINIVQSKIYENPRALLR